MTVSAFNAAAAASRNAVGGCTALAPPYAAHHMLEEYMPRAAQSRPSLQPPGYSLQVVGQIAAQWPASQGLQGCRLTRLLPSASQADVRALVLMWIPRLPAA